MKIIILKPGPTCKCSCRQYNGNDNKKYWYNSRLNIIYSTDCHKNNPIKAIGTFKIDNKTIIQELK